MGAAADMSDLPSGFVLDKPKPQASGLPPGFVLDKLAPTTATAAGAPKQEREGVLGRLWEGLKAGWSDKSFKSVSDVPGGAVGMAGALPARAAYRAVQGIGEAIQSPAKAYEEGMPLDRQQAVQRTLPMATLMAGAGWKGPRTTPETIAATAGRGIGGLPAPATTGGEAAVAGLWNNLKAGGALSPGHVTQPAGQGPGTWRPAIMQPKEQAAAALIAPSAGEAPAAPAPKPAPDLVSTVPTSSFADAIVSNNGGTIDRELTNAYRAAVQPKPLGTPRGRAGLTEQNRRIVTTVDSILQAKPTLRVTDPHTGQKIPFPDRPNMEQFAEGLDHVKKDIFHEYDQLAAKAQGAGARIDLAPVIAKANEIASGIVAQDLSPAMRAEATRLAEVMSQRGSYTPLQAQEMIEGINEISKGFWRGGAAGRDTTSIGALNQIAHVLRDQLDKGITASSGPGYQALKLRYQALRSVEDDLVLALSKMANKPGGGLPYDLADLFSVHQLLHGVIDPTSLPRRVGSAIAAKSARELVRALKDPNRAIGRMFDARANVGRIPPGRPYSTLGALGAGVTQDNRGPQGGRIINQTSIPLGNQ